MVAGYKGFGDRYVYIPPCLRQYMSRQSPTPDTRTIFTQSELTTKARSLMGRLSVADVHSIEASQIISDMLDLEDEADQFHAMSRRTECIMFEVREMVEDAMAIIEDGFKTV